MSDKKIKKELVVPQKDELPSGNPRDKFSPDDPQNFMEWVISQSLKNNTSIIANDSPTGRTVKLIK